MQPIKAATTRLLSMAARCPGQRYPTMNGLLADLTENCCQGNPAACGVATVQKARKRKGMAWCCPSSSSVRGLWALPPLRASLEPRGKSYSVVAGAGLAPGSISHEASMPFAPRLIAAGCPDQALEAR